MFKKRHKVKKETEESIPVVEKTVYEIDCRMCMHCTRERGLIFENYTHCCTATEARSIIPRCHKCDYLEYKHDKETCNHNMIVKHILHDGEVIENVCDIDENKECKGCKDWELRGKSCEKIECKQEIRLYVN